MSGSLQAYLARTIKKAEEDVEAAFLRLPEDKRTWSPMGDSRSALDQVAEVALLNGSVAEIIVTRKWRDDFSMDQYFKAKAELATDWNAAKAMLDENTPKLIAVVAAVPDEDLSIEVVMPWGPLTMEQIIAYPFWNMAYHEGQINYIASMIGCLP